MRFNKLTKQHSDEEIVQLYRATKDPRVLGHLFKRYQEDVLGWCLYILKDGREGEDAVMEVFIRVQQALDTDQPPILKVRSWLYIITRNYCYRQNKRWQAMAGVLTVMEHEEQGLPQAGTEAHWDHNFEMEDLDQLDLLNEAIENLEPLQRNCITLFYLQQLSYQQIAAKLGYEVHEIRSFLQNGRRNLRNRLQKHIIV